jgi:hypothetical protein
MCKEHPSWNVLRKPGSNGTFWDAMKSHMTKKLGDRIKGTELGEKEKQRLGYCEEVRGYRGQGLYGGRSTDLLLTTVVLVQDFHVRRDSPVSVSIERSFGCAKVNAVNMSSLLILFNLKCHTTLY